MQNDKSMLISHLLKPSFYNHSVDKVELVETHISWIFLAGEFAYKLKKPFNYGFLDFSTLEKRHFFCQEELRLNRRFAPQLYLETCSIGGAQDKLQFGGNPPLDYLVKMRRFPSDAQLDRIQASGRLRSHHMDCFVAKLVEFHRQAAIAEKESAFGSPEAVISPILQNFIQLRSLPLRNESVQQLNELEQWSKEACRRLRTSLHKRKEQGFIRECHGDVHLANMVWFEDQPVLFDCIEFSENLRWIDLFNDLSFLLMDLDDRGETTLGWRFLNLYLQQTGDYPGLELLNFYKLYRAMVRAKVNYLRLNQNGLSEFEKETTMQLADSYLELGSGYTVHRRPVLIVSHGLSGSGKTNFVTKLAPVLKAISLHSDVERKRLHNLPAFSDSHSSVGGGLYNTTSGEKTYQELARLAELVLRTGYPVIIDATFIYRWQRQCLHELAKKLNVPFLILDFSLSEEDLRRRIARRQTQTGQISEADDAVLDYQLSRQEPLLPDERKTLINVNSCGSVHQVADKVMRKAS